MARRFSTFWLHALAMACATASFAVDRTWFGGSGDSKWTTPANWSPPPASKPSGADILIFGNGTSDTQIDGDLNIYGLRYTGTGTHTVSGGGAVGIGLGGVVVSAGQIVNFNSWLRPSTTGNLTYENDGILNFGPSTNHQTTVNSTTIFTGSGTTTIGKFSRRRSDYDLTVIKNGSGTLIVSAGENRAATSAGDGYSTGDFTIQAGTFLARNISSSATGAGSVTTHSGATIGGNGSFVGNTGKSFNLMSGATLRVGNTHQEGGAAQALQIGSGGAFNLADITTNAVNVLLNGNLQFDLTGAGKTLAIGHESYDTLANNDLLRVFSAGALNLDSAQISLASADATGWEEGQIWKLIDWSGAELTQLSTTGLSLSTTQLHGWYFTPTIVNSGSGAGYYLTVSAVPEPTYATLFGLGLISLFLRRRR